MHHNRLYFLIIFKNNNWEFGDLFLRKYITSFNYDSHTISFYKEQIDNINKRTDIPYPEAGTDPPETEEKETDKLNILEENNYNIRLIIEIIMGIILIIAIGIIVCFVLKWKKMRKKRADELIDDYEYIHEGDKEVIN